MPLSKLGGAAVLILAALTTDLEPAQPSHPPAVDPIYPR
jgi:hypothetical protein